MEFPPWLKHASESLRMLPPSERVRLEHVSANWLNLFKAHKTLLEIDCLWLIVMELEGKKRPDIIAKLKYWYNERRHEREINELWNGTAPKARAGRRGEAVPTRQGHGRARAKVPVTPASKRH